MNLLFLTQGKTLSVFFDVMKAIRQKEPEGKTAFYLSGSAFFRAFSKSTPELTAGGYSLLKEWEIIGKASDKVPDLARLRTYEERLGDPVLWNVLVADRRVYLGKRATLVQDYPSRFNHEQMLSILQVAVEEMERVFDETRPDAVVGFICVTLGEYLAYLIAKSRNIPFLNFRPTRIKNLFHVGESALEPSRRLEDAFQGFVRDGVPPELRDEIVTYLQEVRQSHAMYEGVVPAANQMTPGSTVAAPKSPVANRALGLLRNALVSQSLYRFGSFRHDNSYTGAVYPLWVKKAVAPVRTRLLSSTLGRRYVTPAQLESLEYVFFPLHKEPEVTLLVYSRPYMNQIEVVRNLARSLPVGMKLVVKEHPAGVGYHPLGYYRKLLAIPGVLLAPPGMKSRVLIERARLIAIISGSIGLEALMMKKPVIHFGRIPFGVMPDTMIRYISDPDRLAWDIRELLVNHRHDEQALMIYIAAVMKTSIPIDFYSVLLERSGVYRPDSAMDGRETKIRNIQCMADHLVQLVAAGRS